MWCPISRCPTNATTPTTTNSTTLSILYTIDPWQNTYLGKWYRTLPVVIRREPQFTPESGSCTSTMMPFVYTILSMASSTHKIEADEHWKMQWYNRPRWTFGCIYHLSQLVFQWQLCVVQIFFDLPQSTDANVVQMFRSDVYWLLNHLNAAFQSVICNQSSSPHNIRPLSQYALSSLRVLAIIHGVIHSHLHQNWRPWPWRRTTFHDHNTKARAPHLQPLLKTT